MHIYKVGIYLEAIHRSYFDNCSSACCGDFTCPVRAFMHVQETASPHQELQKLHLAAVRGYDANCEADFFPATVSLDQYVHEKSVFKVDINAE